MDFAKLKAMSGKKSLDALNNQIAKIANKDSGKKNGDNRFWTPTTDKAGNGMAIIRFLPPSEGEDVPFVRVYDHSFQGPTGLWYIENSLTTIGKADPVSEYNNKLWNSGSEAEKDIARKQKRRLHFISNIYVVQDQANPSNEGKVFLFKYGKKIFDKLNEAMNPQFEDEKPINPFDFWQGANLKLKIRMVDGYRNYDKSEFDKVKPLFEDDDEIEQVWKTQHSLNSFLSETNFKTYDELKDRFTKVLALDNQPRVRETMEETPPPSYKVSKQRSLPVDSYDEVFESEEAFRDLLNRN